MHIFPINIKAIRGEQIHAAGSQDSAYPQRIITKRGQQGPPATCCILFSACPLSGHLHATGFFPTHKESLPIGIKSPPSSVSSSAWGATVLMGFSWGEVQTSGGEDFLGWIPGFTAWMPDSREGSTSPESIWGFPKRITNIVPWVFTQLKLIYCMT